MEDDFAPVPDFNERLSELQDVPEDAELIMLGANLYHCGAGSIPPVEVNDKVLRVFSAFTTHALIVKESIYDVVLAGIDKLNQPLDIVYLTDVQSRGKSYTFKKNLVKQLDGYSDIVQFSVNYNAAGFYD